MSTERRPVRRTRPRAGEPRRVSTAKRGTTRGWVVADGATIGSRSLWLLAAFMVAALLLGWRLTVVQISEAPSLSAQAVAEHEVTVALPAARGTITDSSGNVLASDVTVYDIFGDPLMIPASSRSLYARELAPILGLSTATITADLSKSGQFVYLVRQASAATYEKLQNLNLIGIGAIPSEERVYPLSPVSGYSLAANLLGFVDQNGNGQYGAEQYYNSQLQGKAGTESVVHDLIGNVITLGPGGAVPPQNGDNLQLGLDSQVQYWSEQALATAVKAAQGTSGSIIVLDTKTGAIKALATYPSFNANAYGSASYQDLIDPAVSTTYEPGSVMKVITFAGALNNHTVTPGTIIYDAPVTIGGATIRDWDLRTQGNVTAQWVLDDSLNDGALKVGQLQGDNNFYKTFQNFGIGANTGVDLSGEAAYPLAPQANWTALDYAEASFGQGIEVTPLQMAAALNAVANGGVWVQPHAVESITNPNTGKVTNFVPATRRVMSTQAAATLATMMTHVVDDPGAEGFLAQIPGFKGEVAAKTGTASVAVNGAYGNNVIVSFGGFLPASNPQFTMLVVIDYPLESSLPREGSFLAAPTWKELAELMINEWKIKP